MGTRVVYIMGSSRSGSTILDLILGSDSRIEGVGELVYFPDQVFGAAQYCACGTPAERCSFWSEVREHWTAEAGNHVVTNFNSLQQSFIRYRHLFRVSRQNFLSSRAFKAYSRQVAALYSAISAVSGKSVIVDSSKNPIRALALSRVPDLDLRVIHLVRDCRGVVWSKRKAFRKDRKAGIEADLAPKTTWQAVRFWIGANFMSECVLIQLPRRRAMRLRYEDLISDPEKSLKRIGELIEYDLGDLEATLASHGVQGSRHTVAGNKIRMSRNIKLRLDRDWAARLSPAELRFIWRRTSWLMRRYGYPKCVEERESHVA